MVLVGGRYRLLGRLGEGGMGIVWEARDEQTGREVVVKTMHADGAADVEALGRFVREAKLALPLQHPNVIGTLALVTDGPYAPAIVLERLRGETLADRLARGLASGPEAARIGVALADALAAVHDAGIVHRDVKPSNVFLCEGSSPPVVKLIDFGIARGLGPALTRTGVIVGTPEYMAPELVGGVVDPRADVYAVGATLYEALTGRTPFEAEGVRLVKAIVVDEVPPLDALRPDLDAELVAIVHQALAKNPELRFATAATMRGRLASWLAIVDAAATRDVRATGAQPAPKPAPRRRPRSRLWALSLAPAALALALGVGAVAARLSAPAASRPAPTSPPSSAAPVADTSAEASDPPPLASAPTALASASSSSPATPSARASKAGLAPRYELLSQNVEDPPDDESSTLSEDISAYAATHLGLEACVPLDPPECNHLTLHLTGGDFSRGSYSATDCHTPAFRACVTQTTKKHPFVTRARGTRWTATLFLHRPRRTVHSRE